MKIVVVTFVILFNLFAQSTLADQPIACATCGKGGKPNLPQGPSLPRPVAGPRNGR